MALVAHFDIELHLLDVKIAFFSSDTDEMIFFFFFATRNFASTIQSK